MNLFFFAMCCGVGWGVGDIDQYKTYLIANQSQSYFLGVLTGLHCTSDPCDFKLSQIQVEHFNVTMYKFEGGATPTY